MELVHMDTRGQLDTKVKLDTIVSKCPYPSDHICIQVTPFLHGFADVKKQKKTLTDSRRKLTEISDFVDFIWVISLPKREIFPYFCLFF